MPRFTLVMNGVNRADHATADALAAAGLSVRVVDLCLWEAFRYPRASAGSAARPLRTTPTLFVDDNAGVNELEKQEGSGIDPAATKTKNDTGVYAGMTGTPIVDPAQALDPDADVLARLKTAERLTTSSTTDQQRAMINNLLDFIRTRF